MAEQTSQEANTRMTTEILELLALKPVGEHKVRQKTLTTEEYYATELPHHKKYLLEYHVSLCDCELPECLNAHSPAEQRRIPVITETWKWSYFPHKCKQGAACTKVTCSKSHNDDEVKYHPTVYKTKRCTYPLSEDWVCTGFGPHCPFAHSENDLRSGLRPEASEGDEEKIEPLMSPRSLSHKVSAPPFQASSTVAANLAKLQLHTSIDKLKALVTCGGCSQFEKEWLLDCGHLVCSVCCSGQLRVCPVCGESVKKLKAVRLG